MSQGRQRRGGQTLLVLVGALLCFSPATQANGPDNPPPLTPGQLRKLAEFYEAGSEWDKACSAYNQLLQRDPQQPSVREKYHLCWRRDQQMRRLQDPSYRVQTAGMSLRDSLQVYADVLTRLQANYVDRNRVAFSALVEYGLQELRTALDDKALVLLITRTGPVADQVRGFRQSITEVLKDRVIRRPTDAQAIALELARLAERDLDLKPALVVLEMTCGACSALDEYSNYLTPKQYEDWVSASRPELAASIGVELGLLERTPVVTQVLPESSAQEKGLKLGDRLLRVGARLTAGIGIEQVRQWLQGSAGSTVEIEILALGDMSPRVLSLRRQVLRPRTVLEPRLLDIMLGIGYVNIAGFQEYTPQELDQALAKLLAQGMRALVLDLRGNLGGDFEVAVQVAERFLSSGIIVSTHGQAAEYNQIYQATGMSTLTTPLVVLIDGETASSAEMLAGALKDNQRATLVGQSTFGKGTIQKVRPLRGVPAAVRLTVARFYSPLGHTYSGVGVTPNLVVPRGEPPAMTDLDPQLQAALQVARPLVMDR